ncbi:MAG: RsiV family protein [Bacteroidaceae bacterium]|nr:RsiV family protein [Bacteroidaceae bacterium]
MKRTLFSFVVMVAVILVSAAKCRQDEVVKQLTNIHVVWADSVAVSLEAQARIVYDLVFPIDGPEGVADSVMAWLMPVVADSASLAPHADSLDFAKAIDGIGLKALSDDVAELETMVADGHVVSTERITKVAVAYEDSLCITYLATIESYLGGAHGSYAIIGATFRKADGRRMSYSDLLADRTPVQVRNEIKEGLKAYFYVSTDSELREQLFGKEDFTMSETEYANFPLPALGPWLEKDGVHIQYQQYEIACYAAGMPAVVLPASKYGKSK